MSKRSFFIFFLNVQSVLHLLSVLFQISWWNCQGGGKHKRGLCDDRGVGWKRGEYWQLGFAHKAHVFLDTRTHTDQTINTLQSLSQINFHGRSNISAVSIFFWFVYSTTGTINSSGDLQDYVSECCSLNKDVQPNADSSVISRDGHTNISRVGRHYLSSSLSSSFEPVGDRRRGEGVYRQARPQL